VSTDIHPDPSVKQLPEAARDAARALAAKAEEGVEHTRGLAHHALDATRNAAHRATNTAREVCQSAALKAGDTLETSKEHVRRNPVSMLFGALVIGAAIGYVVMSARRKPTFSKWHVEEAPHAVRDAILTALAPVSKRVHGGYESACDGVGKAIDRVHGYQRGRAVDSMADRIGRVGSNLKFW